MTCRVLLSVSLLVLLTAWTLGGEGDADELARDRMLIQGTWSVVAYDQDGKPIPDELLKKMTVRIKGETLTITPRVVAQRVVTVKDDKRVVEVKFSVEEGKADETKYRLAVAKKRNVIELPQEGSGAEGKKTVGLYELKEDMLVICLPVAERKLPKKMPTIPTAGVVRLVLKKVPPEGK